MNVPADKPSVDQSENIVVASIPDLYEFMKAAYDPYNRVAPAGALMSQE